MNIPHSLPTVGAEEAKGLQDVISSARIATGEEVEAFENALATYVGLKGAVATSSGTAALHLALLAVGVKEGDEVICPSFTCSAILNAIYHCRATPRIVDVDDATMNISLSATYRALGKKTAAIIVPHMFGNPVEAIDDFLALGPPIIEDCAQSLGAASKNKMTGSWGAVAIFSFYATKVITTGQGGMVASDNKSFLEQVRDLRQYDKKDDYLVRYNYCMTDFQGKMGLIQLEKLPSFLKKREERARLYDKYLQEIQEITMPQRSGIYYRYVVRIPGGKLARVIARMHQEGVDVQLPVFRPLHRYLGLDGFTSTEKVYAGALSLPLYPRLEVEAVKSIARSLATSLQQGEDND
jgi:perosamine synthetase